METANYTFKSAGALIDLQRAMRNPVNKWGPRAALIAAGHAPIPPGQLQPPVAKHIQNIGLLAKLRAAEASQALRDLQQSSLHPITKIGAVPSHEKQVRRAMRALSGGHDFHGTGALSDVVAAGGLKPGTRNTFGKGVYYTQDKPAWEYWSSTLAHGPRQGGAIVPREISGSQPAKFFGDRPGAYRVGPSVPLSKEIMLVANQEQANALKTLQTAQRTYKVRPLTLKALSEAHARLSGEVPLQQTRAYRKLISSISEKPLGSALGRAERAVYGLKNLLHL